MQISVKRTPGRRQSSWNCLNLRATGADMSAAKSRARRSSSIVSARSATTSTCQPSVDAIARLSLAVTASGGELVDLPAAEIAGLPDLGAAFTEGVAWRCELARLSIAPRP